jgi:hypothetical protein
MYSEPQPHNYRRFSRKIRKGVCVLLFRFPFGFVLPSIYFSAMFYLSISLSDLFYLSISLSALFCLVQLFWFACQFSLYLSQLALKVGLHRFAMCLIALWFSFPFIIWLHNCIYLCCMHIFPVFNYVA